MEKTVNWGILGLGAIAHKFAEGLKYVKNAKLYAVGSRDREKALQFAKKYKAQKYYGSYEELASGPEIDIIYIATPHTLHCENTLLCIRNKKSVLCEKPFAINSGEVKRMINSAKENNVFLMEALWTRFLPHIKKTLALINSGNIGEPRILSADFGFRADYNPAGRLFNLALGGGSLLDVGIYPVFLSLLLFGKPDEITACANIGKTGTDENCGIIFKYNDGKMAILYSTLISYTPISAEIHGSKGTIKINPKWFTPTDIMISEGLKKPENVKIKHVGNGYNYEAEEATRCLMNKQIESGIMPLSFSLELINTLDKIRKACGIYYPGHD